MLREHFVSVGLVVSIATGFLLFAGCEKDYTPVTSFHQHLLSPKDVNADLAQGNRIAVTWDMADPDNLVHGFVVSIADTGQVLYERALEGASVRTYTSTASDLFDPTKVDSTWYFVQVRAYDENLFQGPPSDRDSLLVP